MEKALFLFLLLKMTPGIYSEKNRGDSPSFTKNEGELIGTFPVVGTLNLVPPPGKVNFDALIKRAMKDKDLCTRNDAKTQYKKRKSNYPIL